MLVGPSTLLTSQAREVCVTYRTSVVALAFEAFARPF